MRFFFNLKTTAISLIVMIVWCFLMACGGGSSGSTLAAVDSEEGVDYNITGNVQKGPFILWSNITIQELNNNLEPKGNVYLTYTTNDKGQFNIETKIKSRFVEIIGDGYYFDEISGELSASTLSLRTISDLKKGANINVNILTTLTCARIKKLIEGGMSFSDAVLQAKLEMLSEFNIPNLTDEQDLVSFDKLDITNAGDGNAVLLAVSCIIQQVATNRASSYSTVTSELSEFLPRMAIDFGDDGQIDDEDLKDDIKSAGMTVNIQQVRSNLENRYSDLGENINAPTFEDYIDSDGDAIINGNEDDTPETFSFNDYTNTEINTLFFSDEVTINGLSDWGYSIASIDNGILIKNGSELGSNSTTVINEDTIQIKLVSSSSFGGTVSADLQVGTETQRFSITARIPQLVYVQGYDYNASAPADYSSVYFAVPIYPTENLNAKYLGIGMYTDSMLANDPLDSISIYTDNSDEPGIPVISSTTFGSYFTGSYEDLVGNIYDSHPQSQAYLGTNAVNLNGNTKYWIVVKYASSTEPGLQGLYASVPFSERKKSMDGTTWTTWNGAANGRYSSNTVKIFLSN